MNVELTKNPRASQKKFLLESQTTVTNFNSILCRLCANTSERFIGIYGEEGLSNELSNKMNLYLPIKVSESDTLPLQCCWNCASTVLAWHELVAVVVEADRRLSSMQNDEICKSEFDVYETFEETTSPLVVEEERFDVRLPAAGLNVFCQESTLDITQPKSPQTAKPKNQSNNTKKQYLVHCNLIADASLLKYLENIQNPIIEPNVPANSLRLNKNKDAYQSPEKSDCSSLIVPDPAKIDSDELNDFKDEPLRTNDSINKIKQIEPLTTNDGIKDIDIKKVDIGIFDVSLESNKDEPITRFNFSCQYCPFMFVTEDSILSHVKTEHSDKHLDEANLTTIPASNKKKMRCKKLDQTIINAAEMVIEGRVYYSCKICGKILHSPYTYIWHIRIHTGERPYVCDLCGKQFRISQGLVRHVRETHEGVKKFECDICERKFATRRNVQEHRRIHTNERPYICDLCGKSFKQKASLFVHNRSHSDSYPFTCTYCNQGFRTRPPLLIHITRHTGEKPYPCDVCGRLFRIKYELKRHKLVHSEDKPYSCGECGLHFRQKRYLKNHNKTSHKQLT